MRAFSYTIKQAFSQIGRNKNMSTASVFAITAMMLILGVFFTIMVNVNLMTQNVENQFDTIQLYLKDDVTAEQAAEMVKEISAVDGVADATYLTKEDAMEIMKERWGEKASLLDGLSENPFPASIEITASDIADEQKIVASVENMEGVDEVKFYKDVIDKVLSITGYIQTGALVLIAILVVVSIIVVANTIKLTVHAREEEIHIMKYVGATNWFVRGPFLVEGIIIGVIASLIAVAIVGFGYYKFVDVFSSKVLILFSTGMIPYQFIIENLIIIFVALGISIGSLGSILSMRRFLKA